MLIGASLLRLAPIISAIVPQSYYSDTLLGYSDWVNFKNAIEKAKIACKSTGFEATNHFSDTTRMVALGSGAKRSIDDVALSRYACYLIAMNADPSKPEIADAQTYFALQTRKQEVYQQLSEEQKRLLLRNRVKDSNKELGKAAKNAGVTKYGLFFDVGYRGLYGIGLKDLKVKKGIPIAEDLLDCVERQELAANEFRITQTEAKLRRDPIKGDIAARETHRQVGNEVRNAIKKVGGILPENLPRAKSIKQLEKERKTKIKELPPSA